MVGRSSVFRGGNSPRNQRIRQSDVTPKQLHHGKRFLLFLPPELHHSNATGDEHPIQEAHRSPSSFFPSPPETTLQHLQTERRDAKLRTRKRIPKTFYLSRPPDQDDDFGMPKNIDPVHLFKPPLFPHDEHMKSQPYLGCAWQSHQEPNSPLPITQRSHEA